jgi:drug/metabolite transporter superfamily protein YnfA
MKSKLLYPVASLILLAGGYLLAQPRENVGGRHPNLAAAQRLCRQAWQRTVDAQQANEWDMAGHAQRAKELLDQAGNELKLAAEAANRRK